MVHALLFDQFPAWGPSFPGESKNPKRLTDLKLDLNNGQRVRVLKRRENTPLKVEKWPGQFKPGFTPKDKVDLGGLDTPVGKMFFAGSGIHGISAGGGVHGPTDTFQASNHLDFL
eukprot:TRINITY_DN37778_c0_g1_i1.p1 TRINITY_DN37778_c0_g1~~TRINITY_DN37778_c0_g1_i1.p1  ORF type:complete len:115 (+),score=26.55 TRINITY_DN37778_c0_g1_i1:63-407(+)